MSSLLAFLHHLAAFALFAAMAVELALLRTELAAGTACRVLRADVAFGAAAGVLLTARGVGYFG